MLPQMMPLPWLIVFFGVFFSYWSLQLYMFFFYPVYYSPNKSFLAKVSEMPW